MGKRIVIALGGNALGNNLPEQMQAVKQTSKAIVDLIEQGHQVVIAPGSMLPKVQAAVEFAESKPGRSALITLLEKARDGVAGKTGTVIKG